MSQSRIFDQYNSVAIAIGLLVDLIAIYELFNRTDKTTSGISYGLSSILFISAVYLMIFGGIASRRFFHNRIISSSSRLINRNTFHAIEHAANLTQYLLSLPIFFLLLVILPWDDIWNFLVFELPLGIGIYVFVTLGKDFTILLSLLLISYLIVRVSKYTSKVFYILLNPNHQVNPSDE